MTLSDGSSCLAGTEFKPNKSFTLDESTHICKIDIIARKDELGVGQIIFYDKNGIIYTVGTDTDAGTRKETFLIGD